MQELKLYQGAPILHACRTSPLCSWLLKVHNCSIALNSFSYVPLLSQLTPPALVLHTRAVTDSNRVRHFSCVRQTSAA